MMASASTSSVAWWELVTPRTIMPALRDRHRIDEHAVEIEDDRAHPIAFGHECSLRKRSGLERRPSDRREGCLTPRRGREQAPIVPWRCDQLQSERQAVRAETARDDDRRRAHQRPARAEARVAGRFGCRGLA